MAVLLAVGGAYALSSWDWCGHPEASAPKLVSRLQASGPLSAGAAAVEVKVPYPIVTAGYGPPLRQTVSSGAPIMARAVVLRSGDVTFGLVAVDLVLVPDDVAAEVRAKSGLGDTWVAATHTHSSMGGYDKRLVAQLAGTGRFREDARSAVVVAAVDALKAAAGQLVPVTAQAGHGTWAGNVPRTGAEADPSLHVLALGEVARLELLAAHPTTVKPPATALDPDYPGRLAGDAGVTLVLQTAGANASTAENDPVAAAASAFGAIALHALDAPALSVTRVQLTPPAPDASRLVPRLFSMPGKNFLCASAPREAEVGVFRLGDFELAAVPAEVTFGAAQVLGVTPLSLANGYLGYVEPADVVERGEGESKRQYYAAGLLEAFRAALAVARQPSP
ncbi:MAG: hypothetical protein JNK82_26280 [Myxococcaceae bacterium]|nr:hypothetical protein [Myxococcaceae bacterium]